MSGPVPPAVSLQANEHTLTVTVYQEGTTPAAIDLNSRGAAALGRELLRYAQEGSAYQLMAPISGGQG